MNKTVLFDLDGTLLDTLQDLQESLNTVLAEYGQPQHTSDEVRRFVGNGLPKLVERALKNGTAHPQYEEILLDVRKQYSKNSRNHTKPYEGILPMLQILHQKKMRLGVVSNKPDEEVKQLCAHFFSPWISVAIGAAPDRPIKPAPDAVFLAMEQLNSTFGNTVYVGDSEVDVQTAANAKIDCCCVLWGFRDRALLTMHGAARFAESPEILLSILTDSL